MWSWIRERRDPFTRSIGLECYRPFTFSHDQAVRFQAANGSHWLLLDSVYSGRRGATVHVVRSTELDLGGGMDNFAENLAEAVRQLDPAAIAMFSYWPAEPDSSDPEWEPPIRRLTFEPAPEGQPGPGGTYILDERNHQLLSQTQTGGPVRYQMASFWHFGFEEVAQMLGALLSVESPTEVAARAHRLARWAELAADVRFANDESWDTFRAQLREWNVD